MIHHQPARGKARCSAAAHTTVTARERAAGVTSVIRRLVFVVVMMVSVAVAACGRIVTVPKTSSVVPSGDMSIIFTTEGPLDFTDFQYVVAFNTSGNGQYPLATSISSFLNWSFELIFGNSGGGVTYALQQIYSNAGSYSSIGLTVPPQFVTFFNPNSNGLDTQFTFTFNRALLAALVTPSPAPASTPSAPPFVSPGVSTLWAMNFFSVTAVATASAPAGTPVDSIGVNGATDTAPQCCIVTTTQLFDQTFNKPIPPPVQVTSSAQIVGIQVINTP